MRITGRRLPCVKFLLHFFGAGCGQPPTAITYHLADMCLPNYGYASLGTGGFSSPRHAFAKSGGRRGAAALVGTAGLQRADLGPPFGAACAACAACYKAMLHQWHWQWRAAAWHVPLVHAAQEVPVQAATCSEAAPFCTPLGQNVPRTGEWEVVLETPYSRSRATSSRKTELI